MLMSEGLTRGLLTMAIEAGVEVVDAEVVGVLSQVCRE